MGNRSIASFSFSGFVKKNVFVHAVKNKNSVNIIEQTRRCLLGHSKVLLFPRSNSTRMPTTSMYKSSNSGGSLGSHGGYLFSKTKLADSLPPFLGGYRYETKRSICSYNYNSAIQTHLSSSVGSIGKSSSSLFLRPAFHPLTLSTPTTVLHQIQYRNLANQRHKKIVKMAKHYRGRTNCYRIALAKVQKGLQYAYRDRKTKKRDFRSLWIERLNAAVRQYEMNYSRFIPALKKKDISLNRKILSEIAITEPYSFRAIIETVKKQ